MRLRNMGFGLLITSAIGLSLVDRTAEAAVLHLNASDTAVFSLDASGVLTPPITSFSTTVNFAGTDPLNPGEGLQISFFDQLNGPSLGSRTFTNTGNVNISGLGLATNLTPPLADATGFLTIRAIGGSFDFNLPLVSENLVSVAVQFVGINNVPEPTSLALLAIGVASLGFSRRSARK